MALLKTNTGIGTTNPTSALHVIGDVLVTGVVTSTTFNGNINTGVATITTATITNLTNTRLTSGIGTINNLNNTFLNVSGVGSIANLHSPNAAINVGVITDLTNTRLTSGIATINNLISTASTITNLTGTNATITRINSTHINAGIVTATQLSTGAVGVAINITSNSITGPSSIVIDPAAVGDDTGAVRIKGDLYVDGTQFVINSGTIELADLRVGIATTVGSNLLLDGGGIGIGSTNILKTFTYNYVSDSLKSSENLDISLGKTYKVGGTDVLSSDTLGSGVIYSSLQYLGTLNHLNVSGLSTLPSLVGSYATITEIETERFLSGISSITDLYASNGYINVGLVTDISGTRLNYTGVGTISTIDTNIADINNLRSDYIDVGVATAVILNSGIGTITNLNSALLNISGVGTIATLNSTYTNLTNINATGISTLADIRAQRVTVTGIVTANSFRPTSGYIQAADGTNSFYIYNTTGNVSFQGTIGVNQINNASGFQVLTFNNLDTRLTGNLNIAGVTTSSVFNGNIYSLGVSTFRNGPVLIGTGTSTGTAFQPLQVTGGGYISDNLGLGIIAPTSKLDVVGDGRFTGVVTATTFNGDINAGVSTLGVATAINLTSQQLIVSGLSTFVGVTTFQNDVYVSGDLYVTNDLKLDEITARNVNVTGVATIFNLVGTAATITTSTITDLSNTRLTSGIATITDLNVTNSTFNNLNATNLNAVTGIVTEITGTRLNYTGVGTITTLDTDTATINNLTSDYANVGVTTVSILSSGIGTIADLNNTRFVSGIATVTTLNATNIVSTNSDFTNLNANTANIDVGIVTDISGTRLNYTGVGTIATLDTTNGTIDYLTNTDLTVSGIATITSLSVLTNFDVYDTTATFHNNVFISGNLSIGGTSSVIIAQDLKVLDKEITLGITTNTFNQDVSTDTTANHGGISIASTEGYPLVDLSLAGFSSLPATYKQLMWVAANSYGVGTTDAWMFNYAVGIGSTIVPNNVRFAVGEVQITDHQINAVTGEFDRLISGIATFTGANISNLHSNNFFSQSGIITDLSGIRLNYTGFGTITNLYSADAYIDDIASNVGFATAFTAERLNVSGVGTIATLNSTTSTITNLNVTNSTFANANVNNLYAVSGIVTTFTSTHSNLTNINSTGISTLNIVRTNTISSSGVVTAPTFVGDLLGVANYAHVSGYSTFSGYSNTSGFSTFSGYTNAAGVSTFANYANVAGIATYAWTAGVSTYSGVAGYSTFSGYSNTSGFSTFSGYANAAGVSTFSGYSNTSGFSTFSGYANNSGIATYAWTAGVSTYSGVAGYSTFSGYSNTSGFSTFSNYSDTSGFSTFSGYANASGVSTSVIGGIASVTQLNVSGIATINQLDVNQLSPDGSNYGIINFVPVADGVGTWSWQPVTSAGAGTLDGITIREEGSTVGTAGSITNLDFRGNNIIVTAIPLGAIATITTSDTPTFDSLNVTGVSTLGFTTISTLYVAGVSTFSGITTTGGDLFVGADLNVAGDLNFNGTLYQNGVKFTSGIGIGSTSVNPQSGIISPTDRIGIGFTDINIVGTGISIAGYGSTVVIDFGNISGGGGSNVSISTISPGISTSAGDLWWDSVNGDLKIYYVDSNSSQWIDANGGSQALAIVSSTEPSGYGITSVGTLWYNTISGVLNVYYDNGISPQWVDAYVNYWTPTSTGIHTLGNVGLGTTNPTEKLQVNGQLSIDGNVSYGTTTFATASTAQVGIHSALATATYRSVEYTIQATEGTNFHTTKIIALHDGSNAYHSEYGTIFNNVGISTYDVDVSGGNIRLIATPASSSTTNFKISFTAIKV